MEQFEGGDQGHRDDEAYREYILEKLDAMGAPPPPAVKGALANELVRRHRLTKEEEK